MLDDQKIAQLKAAHGDKISLVEFEEVVLAFRKPNRQEYNRWFDKRDEGKSPAALELAASVLVYPTHDEFMAALDKYPGLLMVQNGVLDAITDSAGFTKSGASKKLL